MQWTSYAHIFRKMHYKFSDLKHSANDTNWYIFFKFLIVTTILFLSVISNVTFGFYGKYFIFVVVKVFQNAVYHN